MGFPLTTQTGMFRGNSVSPEDAADVQGLITLSKATLDTLSTVAGQAQDVLNSAGSIANGVAASAAAAVVTVNRARDDAVTLTTGLANSAAASAVSAANAAANATATTAATLMDGTRSFNGITGNFTVGPAAEVFIGKRPRYAASNTVVYDRFAPGINTNNGSIYAYRDTYGTFGQATVGAFIANSGGAGMPQISGYVTASEAGSGGERGSAALYLENVAPAALAILGATFDTTHAYLPQPMTVEQVAKYGKPGTFVDVRTLGPAIGPYSGQIVSISDDRKVITVTGWWIRGNAAAGQNPLSGAVPGPYTLYLGVVTTVWGSASVVSLTPASYADSAVGEEIDFYNDTGSFTYTGLSNVLGDTPRMTAYIVGASEGGISAAYWALARGPAYLRVFAAQNVRNDGAGFVYMDKTSTGTAFYSGQTAGAFLRLAPNDGPTIFKVDAAGTVETVGSANLKGGLLQLGSPTSANPNARLDFLTGGQGSSWDSRIIASGGTGTAGNGTLTLASGGISINAQAISVGGAATFTSGATVNGALSVGSDVNLNGPLNVGGRAQFLSGAIIAAPSYSSNAAAVAAGRPSGFIYQNNGVLNVVQ